MVGFTIGSSPYDESCKKRRKAAATALAKPAMRKYLPMFDLETFCVIRDYLKMAISKDGMEEFNPRPFLQRFALNTTLTLCYGIRKDDAYDELLREILCNSVGTKIIDNRCWQCDIIIAKCFGKLSRLHSRKEV
jgi:phenylacetate 2-hydroxylase